MDATEGRVRKWLYPAGDALARAGLQSLARQLQEIGFDHEIIAIDGDFIDAFLDSSCTLADFDVWRDWLYDLLVTVLCDGETFSGKRANCDSSGWRNTLDDFLRALGWEPTSEVYERIIRRLMSIPAPDVEEQDDAAPG